MHFKIIINCGPCEQVIGECLASVRRQSFGDWQAWVTADACGDDTFARALAAAGGDPRFRIRHNQERRYSLPNLVRSIAESNAAPEDVIVTLDGDDWFATYDALRIIADTYERDDCWVTYGSWLSNVVGPGGRRDGLWPAYPLGTEDFRRTRWLGTAVRTWKKWLWDRLDDADLRHETGEYFRVAEDQAIMIPLLEMSGTGRASHIAEAIMVYNKTMGYAPSTAIADESERIAELLDRRPRYPRLCDRLRRSSMPPGGNEHGRDRAAVNGKC